MVFSIYVQHSNTQAQLDVNLAANEVELSPAASDLSQTDTQETIEVPQAPPMPVADSQAQYYSPVSIILATCALVTAIGRALRPTKQ